jgi:hypothetical protein
MVLLEARLIILKIKQMKEKKPYNNHKLCLLKIKNLFKIINKNINNKQKKRNSNINLKYKIEKQNNNY